MRVTVTWRRLHHRSARAQLSWWLLTSLRDTIKVTALGTRDLAFASSRKRRLVNFARRGKNSPFRAERLSDSRRALSYLSGYPPARLYCRPRKGRRSVMQPLYRICSSTMLDLVADGGCNAATNRMFCISSMRSVQIFPYGSVIARIVRTGGHLQRIKR